MDKIVFTSDNIRSHLHIPRWEELPSIDLYMDQVVTYIHSSLDVFWKHMGCAPLTKNMVNNYVKAKIILPPSGKKYSRLSVAMIIVVYILKNCFSTEDIKKLIEMGLALPDNALTYNRFCDAVENALVSVFSGSIHVDNLSEKGREQKFLMDSFALAFACKIYVQSTFIFSE